MLASYLPARRASRIAPTEALPVSMMRRTSGRTCGTRRGRFVRAGLHAAGDPDDRDRRRRQRRDLQRRQRGAACGRSPSRDAGRIGARLAGRSAAAKRRQTRRPRTFSTGGSRNHSFTGLAGFAKTRSTVCIRRRAGTHRRRDWSTPTSSRCSARAGGRPHVSSRATRNRALRASRSSATACGSDRFGARTDILGQTIRINDEPHTIVGVMPPGIDYPAKAQLWISAALERPGRSARADRGSRAAAQPRLLHASSRRLKPASTHARGGRRHGQRRARPRARLP